jgi:hypothetical protein
MIHIPNNGADCTVTIENLSVKQVLDLREAVIDAIAEFSNENQTAVHNRNICIFSLLLKQMEFTTNQILVPDNEPRATNIISMDEEEYNRLKASSQKTDNS